tara:strand:+ start:162 stop:494 length:333 start_codon:yes stop_codon:yes gene_type:complete
MKNELTETQKAIILKSVDKEMMKNYHETNNVWYVKRLNEIIDILDLKDAFKIDYCDGSVQLYHEKLPCPTNNKKDCLPYTQYPIASSVFKAAQNVIDHANKVYDKTEKLD